MKSRSNLRFVVTILLTVFAVLGTAGVPDVRATEVTLFYDNMESGTGNWTAQYPWALITYTYASPTHCWHDSPAGNYSNNLNISLTLNQNISLGSVKNATLRFNTKYFTESCCDYGYTEVSSDGGPWTSIGYIRGTQSAWTQISYSLNQFVGHNIRVRFRFRTDGSVVYDGWYIDDVSITGESADPLAIEPAEGCAFSGNEGGPFVPSGKDYTLRNTGSSSLNWTAEPNVVWLRAEPNGGTLLPGDTVTVAVSTSTDANALLAGDYNGAVTFRNTTSGISQKRTASLKVIRVPGEIDVTDSIPPPSDLNMPFGEIFLGLSRVGHITVANLDPHPRHTLTVSDILLGGGEIIEDFEDGNISEYVILGGSHTVTTDAAHDGAFGLESYDPSMGGWAYRNDPLVNITQGQTVSYWLYLRSDGRAYCGFGASQAGTYSIVAAPNTGTLLIQLNLGYDHYDIGVAPYLWTPNKWYRLEVQWDVGGSITGRLYDSDGTTLLQTVTANDGTYTSGGIAFRSFGYSNVTNYFDTVSRKNTTDITISMLPNQSFPDKIVEDRQKNAATGWDSRNQTPISEGSFVTGYAFSSQALQEQSLPAPQTQVQNFRLENVPALPLTIPSLGSIAFDVNFIPSELGEYESVVVIKSDDVSEPQVRVKLSGVCVPDYLAVVPEQEFEFSGHPGGPFVPSNTSYHLTNNGPVSINWTAEPNVPWLDVSQSGGSLGAGKSVTVTVAHNSLARSLPKGIYAGEIKFTNTTTTVLHPRGIILNIYTEPKIWITPYSFDVTVSQGDSVSQTLTIGNGGDANLAFAITAQETGFTPPAELGAGGISAAAINEITASIPPDHNFAVPADVPFASDKLLIRFAPYDDGSWPDAAQKNAIISRLGGALIEEEYNTVPGLCLVRLYTGLTTMNDTLANFNTDANILYAEPDYQLQIYSACQKIPNDSQFGQQWNMHNTGQSGGTVDADIDAPEAWCIDVNASNIVVAVIDTGIDYTHPDLAANMWVNKAEQDGTPGVDDDGNGYIDDIYGYDFCNNDGNPMDDHGHGTHCAGIIGAAGDNNQGVAGVCWNAKIMAVKFLNAGGSGYTDDAIKSIQYAQKMGVKVMSNSWGGGGYSQALKDAIDAAGRAGILFVAAAGNDNTNNDIYPLYPSSYDCNNIITVLSTDEFDNKSYFSCYGPTSVDLGAPGSYILSCVRGNQYQYMSGTSMATPHVAGACALTWSACPSMPRANIKNIILEAVDPIPALNGLCVSNGRLNLHNAILKTKVRWLELSASTGSVAPDDANNVNVKFIAEETPGTYHGQIIISTNDPYSPEMTIPVTMTVEPPDYFTELFEPNGNDLAHRTLTFSPNGSGSYYRLCSNPTPVFPVDPIGGTVVQLGDDDYTQINLQNARINLYGTDYDTFYIGSNGYISFVSGDIRHVESFDGHFALPRISALFDDLDPSAGGVISWKQLNDRAVATFENVPEYGLPGSNSFQIEMCFNGKIRITLLDTAAQDGLTGISAGNGLSPYFVESNLSEYGLCTFIGDLNNDKDVDIEDFAIFAEYWQHCYDDGLETLRDEFSSVSYSGNNGTRNWSGDWLESGESDGPGSGFIEVVASGNLRIGDAKGRDNDGSMLTRRADLSDAVSAMLTYDYVVENIGDAGSVNIQVSSDGGSSWFTLATYPYNAGSGSASFDITPYISSNTQIRFGIEPKAKLRMYLHIDDVQIEYNREVDPWDDACDFSHDLKIDIEDLLIFTEHWLE